MTMPSNVERLAPPHRLIAVLFTGTIFTSALLLFFVQPLFTRMVLPQIGGAAAVWTTAMLFFQTVLILGYLYAHLLTRHVPQRAQVAVHLGLLVVALAFLPLSVPDSWRYDPASPVVTQTLWLYALGVGLPFAVLSANAPLIQSWYRQSGGPSAEDPYFLYAASNLGSLVALLAFPLVAEPLFGVSAIAVAWAVGFVALGPMLLLSGLAAGRGPAPVARPSEAGGAVSLKAVALWAFLAFLPSSLMLGVTTKISTDLGSFPLIWVVPLALYLLTFVLAFSTRLPRMTRTLRLVFPLALAALVYFTLRPANTLPGFGIMLAAFLVVGLMAHRLMFDARPDARHLTVYYLTMSVGGALGGIFNSIVAPLAFDRLTELPVTIALCALLLLAGRPRNLPREAVLGLLAFVLVLLPMLGLIPGLSAATIDTRALASVGLLALVFLAAYRTPLVTVVATVGLLAIWAQVGRGESVFQDRSFFGLHLVKDEGEIRKYSNGTTVHGGQLLAELGQRPTPIYYYHPNGPLAEVVRTGQDRGARSFGIVGLGIGALSCYSRPGEDWHYYEIDAKVVEIAQDPRLFGFMSACAEGAPIHLGDARIVLQDQPELAFDVLVIDAYSSDAIPVHLATLEALELYLDRLAPDGVLAFHISNRFYDLSRPIATLVGHLGLEARILDRRGEAVSDEPGDVASTVVVMARTEAALGPLATDPRWQPLAPPTLPLWTDDHADLLSALR